MSAPDRIRRNVRRLRRERRLAGAVTFAVVAFVASGCGSGSTGPDAGEAPRVASRTEIADGGSRPAVSGDRVAYLDVRGQNLVVYDILSRRDTTVFTPGSGPRFSFYPALSGNRVAWTVANDQGTADIRVHDLASGSTTTLTSPETLDGWPDISGDWVIWRSGRIEDAQVDIGVANLADGTTERFPDDPEFDELPTLVGDHRVAWSRVPTPGAPPAMALGNLKTGEWRTISPSPPRQLQVAADGERLVWVWNEERGTNIMFFDLASGERRKLTDDTLSQLQPDISGDLVVWQVEEFGDQDIVVHDLRSGGQRTLTGPDTDEQNPAIDGRRVVWEEWDATGVGVVLVELGR